MIRSRFAVQVVLPPAPSLTLCEYLGGLVPCLLHGLDGLPPHLVQQTVELPHTHARAHTHGGAPAQNQTTLAAVPVLGHGSLSLSLTLSSCGESLSATLTAMPR